MYILHDGQEITADQIKAAFDEGDAVLVHSHGDGKNLTGLMLDGQHRDTRDTCYSMWEEVWTTKPETLQAALGAAYYNPHRTAAA